MLYISKSDEYLKVLTDEEAKVLVVITFSEKNEEQNPRKVAK